MILASWENRLPDVIYWGKPLSRGENLEDLAKSTMIAPTGGMMDLVAGVSLSPEEAGGFAGHPGLILTDETGYNLRPVFIFKEAKESANALELVFEEEDLTYIFRAKADPETNVIKLSASLHSETGFARTATERRDHHLHRALVRGVQPDPDPMETGKPHRLSSGRSDEPRTLPVPLCA